MFDLGLLDLRAKARIETVYWQIAGGRRRDVSRQCVTCRKK